MEATKNIHFAKTEGTVYHNTVTRWCKKFCLSCKHLDDQARSLRPKTVDFETMFETVEANLVSEELSISLSSVFCYLHDYDKNIWS